MSGPAGKADTRDGKWNYERRRPEQTLLYQLVAEHYPRFLELLADQGRSLPHYVQREFDDFLKCGILEHGFLRVRCQDCRSERLVAFSCKRRGFCPSCGARRMVESAALLVDEVLPRLPMRQWVLSFPFQLRFLFASRPEIMSRVLGLVYRAIETHLVQQAGCTRATTAKTGAVTLIQRFGSALNLNIHFHMLFLDGVYLTGREQPVFRRLPAPRPQALEALIQTISQRLGAYLEREGLLVRDIENTYLQLDASDESALNDLLGHSITSATAPALLYLLHPCSRTASPSGPRPGARRSHCRPCPLGKRTATTAAWPRPPGSPCTPASPPRPTSGASSSACAGISPARPWPPIDWL